MNNDKFGYSELLPPLPERMRPKHLDEYIGQQHLIGKGSVLSNMLRTGNITSFILWGPPGVGKTTLARIMANTLNRDFYTLSAINSGVKDIRDVIDEVRKSKSGLFGANKPSPILFIDEIHRFSKSQQDSLLGIVEDGTVILVGATTENPSFEVITPLLSRCQVFVLKPLDKEDLGELLKNVLAKDELLSKKNIVIKETSALFGMSGGDARKLLNLLEIIVEAHPVNEEIIIDNNIVSTFLQENTAKYDKGGEQHYDIISAFIKSMRGSDPNAAIYYLSRMLVGGEDPAFIARRLCIFAAEDVGLANPNALLIAEACFRIVRYIGMPEARIPLAETTIYLASSSKSNSAYNAINQGLDLAKKTQYIEIPLHLRNAPTNLMKELGYSNGYLYPHLYDGHFTNQEYMPKELIGETLYFPSENKAEKNLKVYLEQCWKDKYKLNKD